MRSRVADSDKVSIIISGDWMASLAVHDSTFARTGQINGEISAAITLPDGEGGHIILVRHELVLDADTKDRVIAHEALHVANRQRGEGRLPVSSSGLEDAPTVYMPLAAEMVEEYRVEFALHEAGLMSKPDCTTLLKDALFELSTALAYINPETVTSQTVLRPMFVAFRHCTYRLAHAAAARKACGQMTAGLLAIAPELLDSRQTSILELLEALPSATQEAEGDILSKNEAALTGALYVWGEQLAQFTLNSELQSRSGEDGLPQASAQLHLPEDS